MTEIKKHWEDSNVNILNEFINKRYALNFTLFKV